MCNTSTVASTLLMAAWVVVVLTTTAATSRADDTDALAVRLSAAASVGAHDGLTTMLTAERATALSSSAGALRVRPWLVALLRAASSHDWAEAMARWQAFAARRDEVADETQGNYGLRGSSVPSTSQLSAGTSMKIDVGIIRDRRRPVRQSHRQ